MFFFAYFPCVFRDVADPGVRATGNNDEPIVRAERESRVVQEEIRFSLPVRVANQPLGRLILLEGKPPRDLTEKNKILRDPDRLCGQADWKLPLEFISAHN